MKLKLKNKKDYEAALERCHLLIQKDIIPKSADADELEMLSILTENYERTHYPVPPPHHAALQCTFDS